jgi:crossover junction endodeoxyribonuclease RusA
VPLGGNPGGTAGFSARAWRIELPAGMELLNANDRSGHWARRKRLTSALREAAAWLAHQQHIPRLERAHIAGIYEPPDKRRRDPANWQPSFKACVDGLTDAGVFRDDDSEHVDGPDPRLGPVHPRGRIVLVITELGGGT